MLSETDRLRLERQKAGVDAYGVAEELGQGRVGLGIDSATAADVAKLKRIELLLGGGETAQTLREGRIGMGLDATMGLGKTVQEASGKLWDDLDEEQRDALQAQWEAYTGGKIFGSSQNDKTKAADQEAAGGFIETIASWFA
jgi:hypothetical protein